ncbi:MAG: hypothetical protein WB561_05100 [Terracidiphilus sp.]
MGSRLLASSLYAACVVVWLFILLNCTAQPAYAYIDPGSGLLLLQVIGSMFAGFTFVVRKRLRHLFGRFAKSLPKPENDLELH